MKLCVLSNRLFLYKKRFFCCVLPREGDRQAEEKREERVKKELIVEDKMWVVVVLLRDL